MILNEPETSLHPDLLPALARLIEKASKRTQVCVVSHASRMIASLKEARNCNTITLTKELGETAIDGQGMLDVPPLEMAGALGGARRLRYLGQLEKQ